MHDLFEHWRALRGLSLHEVAREAQVSPTTVKKIRSGENVSIQKVAAVETAIGLPVGSIETFQKHGTLPEKPDETSEHQVNAPSLKKGERLFETTTEHGVRYRLEIAEGYGASYTWSSPRPYHEILPHLRSLSSLVATAGGLIDP